METATLEDLGLSPREARAYLVLLELGTSTIGKIVKRTEIPSSKIYEVLDRLMAKGLTSYVMRKSQKHFQAADPETILNQFEERKKRFEELLPTLKEKQRLAEHQEVELFEGRAAMQKLLQQEVERAKEGSEYLSFSVSLEHDDPEIARFYKNLTARRVAKKMKIRVLSTEKIRYIASKRYTPELMKAINNRYTPFSFPQGMTIVNDKLIMFSWKNNTAICISSKIMSRQFRDFFYELYENAKE